ncbi:mannose-1-phosphate guanylyltransferase [soil metagenome]
MIDTTHTFAVILAGGGGTRLWPKSRTKTPKQFLKLTGKQTMVQVAAQRITKIVDWDHIIVVTNKMYTQEIHEQLPQIPEDNIIAEPEKKDTAMAMLAGAMYAYSMDPEAVVMNAASDHVITNPEGFTRVMKAALEVAAEKKYLVTVGIRPTRPETGFGYIKIGDSLKKLEGNLALFKVDGFTEKPDATTAQAFLSTGKYFWNANMYVWSSQSLIEAFEKYQPEIYGLTKKLMGLNPEAFHAELPAIYAEVKAISIDYAISEKAENLVLIPGDFGWNDVGDWKVVYDLADKDGNNNVVISDDAEPLSLLLNSGNNLIQSNGRLIALYGVNDLVIVDTPEILMIVPKDKSQDVKKLVEKLKADGKKEHL